MTMRPDLFDHAALARNRARALRANTPDWFLISAMEDIVLGRLELVKGRFGTLVINGARHGASFREKLAARCDRLYVMDMAATGAGDVRAAEDMLPFAEGAVDAFISLSTLHTVNDLPGALIQMRRALSTGGLFLSAFWGEMTLAPLRHALMAAETDLTGGAHARIIPMVSREQMAGLMQRAGFDLPVVDSENLTVAYADLRALARDLRAMGETNCLHSRPRHAPMRHLFDRAEHHVRAISPDTDHAGRFLMPFDMVLSIGWKS